VAVQHHWGAADIEAGQKQGIATFSREVAAEMTKLGAKKFEGIEYPGAGHNLEVRVEKIRTFIAAAVRDPFPEQCRLIFHHIYQGRAFYVQATAAAKAEFDFTEKRQVTVLNQDDVPRALRALFVSEGFELTGHLTPATNTVTVFARNIRAVEVELPAEKLDYTRRIRIVLNGRTMVDEIRPLDYADLLETARRTGDFERLVGGRVKLTVVPNN
jgi:hypothetical protein